MGNYIPKYRRGKYRRNQKVKIQVLKEAQILETTFKKLKEIIKQNDKITHLRSVVLGRSTNDLDCIRKYIKKYQDQKPIDISSDTELENQLIDINLDILET